MRIVCIISPYYDYLTATLMEGLQELGHEIISSENSNYTRRTPDRRLRKLSENADLIVVGSNRRVRTWLIEDIDNPHKVFIDGCDQQGFNVYPHIPFKAVFKRELNQKWINTTEEPIYPLPFAAEKRYFVNRADKRDIRVTFAANMNTNTMRNSVYQRLKNKNNPGIFCGTTGEGAYRTQNCLGMPTETPKFRRLLSQTQIGINVAGAGYDCARYWEILAAGALLMTQELDIIIPHPFTDGVNCVVFKSLDEFEVKLDMLLSNPSAVSDIAEAGYQHLLLYHTTTARAGYFLDIATAASSEVFCKEFYSGYKMYSFKKKLLIYLRQNTNFL